MQTLEKAGRKQAYPATPFKLSSLGVYGTSFCCCFFGIGAIPLIPISSISCSHRAETVENKHPERRCSID
jgi:hypothetical protein